MESGQLMRCTSHAGANLQSDTIRIYTTAGLPDSLYLYVLPLRAGVFVVMFRGLPPTVMHGWAFHADLHDAKLLLLACCK